MTAIVASPISLDYLGQQPIFFEFGGALYAFAYTGNLASIPYLATESAFRSVDGGVTWELQDKAFNESSLPAGSAVVTFESDGTVTVASINDLEFVQNVRIYQFSTLTNTWSTLIDSGGPSIRLSAIWPFPAGGYAVLGWWYDVVAFTNILKLYRYDGGWSELTDIVTLSSNAQVTVAADSTGRHHLIFTPFGGDGTYYIGIDADGAVGATEIFPYAEMVGRILVDEDNGRIAFAAAQGGSIFVYTGDSLSAPAWTSAEVLSGEETLTPPVLYFDGESYLILYSRNSETAVNGLVLRGQSASLDSGWTSETIYDADADTTPPFFEPYRDYSVGPPAVTVADNAVYYAADYLANLEGDLAVVCGVLLLSIPMAPSFGNEFR